MKKLNYENTTENIDLGLSIIPVSTQKTPFKPRIQYKKEMAPFNQWYNHYMSDGTIGIICGNISGNLEVIDIDTKNDPYKTIQEEFIRKIPEELLKRLIILTTPNHGLHIYYRCSTIEGNQKLAHHSNGEVIIETRGEGGYVCTSMNRNKVINGQFDLQNLQVDIPEITPEEREFLLDTARGLTRYFPKDKNSKNGEKFKYKEPAINKFIEDVKSLSEAET